MTQVIGKKLRLMNVPVAKEQEQTQQLVITPEGKVRKKQASENQGTDYVFMFRVGNILTDGHSHTVGLTSSDVETLVNSSDTITKTSSSSNGHSHEIVIGYNPQQNRFYASSISIGEDGHSHGEFVEINQFTPPTFTFSGVYTLFSGEELLFENGVFQGPNLSFPPGNEDI